VTCSSLGCSFPQGAGSRHAETGLACLHKLLRAVQQAAVDGSKNLAIDENEREPPERRRRVFRCGVPSSNTIRCSTMGLARPEHPAAAVPQRDRRGGGHRHHRRRIHRGPVRHQHEMITVAYTTGIGTAVSVSDYQAERCAPRSHRQAQASRCSLRAPVHLTAARTALPPICVGHIGQRNQRRRVGPKRAGHFGLRAQVEKSEASNTPVRDHGVPLDSGRSEVGFSSPSPVGSVWDAAYLHGPVQRPHTAKYREVLPGL